MKKLLPLSVFSLVFGIHSLALCEPSQGSEKPFVEIVIPATEKLQSEFFEHQDGILRVLGWGELQELVTVLNTENDNFLLGGGRLLGIKKESSFEGDDFGKTAAFELSQKAKFSHGSLTLALNSDLFTKKTTVDHKSLNSKGEQYIHAVNIDRASMVFERDLENNVFVKVKFEFAKVSDQHGFALAVQEVYHDLAHSAGTGGRQDQILSHRPEFSAQQASVLLGHRFVFYQNKQFKIQALIAVGAGEDLHDRYVINYDSQLLVDVGPFQVTLIHQRDALQTATRAEVLIPLRTRCNSQVALKAGLAKVSLNEDEVRSYDDKELQHSLGLQYSRKLNAECL